MTKRSRQNFFAWKTEFEIC